jgi:hypothetical protein
MAGKNAPADIGKIEYSQTDVVLMISDREILLQADNLRITDIRPIEKRA